jgi:hypothetical protein
VQYRKVWMAAALLCFAASINAAEHLHANTKALPSFQLIEKALPSQLAHTLCSSKAAAPLLTHTTMPECVKSAVLLSQQCLEQNKKSYVTSSHPKELPAWAYQVGLCTGHRLAQRLAPPNNHHQTDA